MTTSTTQTEAKKMAIYCTCCQSELTAPQFHEGKPYGWTCIKRVAPKAARCADPGLWAACEVEAFTDETDRPMAYVYYNGKRVKMLLFLAHRYSVGVDYDAAINAMRAGESYRVKAYHRFSEKKNGRSRNYVPQSWVDSEIGNSAKA